VIGGKSPREAEEGAIRSDVKKRGRLSGGVSAGGKKKKRGKKGGTKGGILCRARSVEDSCSLLTGRLRKERRRKKKGLTASKEKSHLGEKRGTLDAKVKEKGAGEHRDKKEECLIGSATRNRDKKLPMSGGKERGGRPCQAEEKRSVKAREF